MALNLATLKTRTLTAAVFVLVMMTGLLWSPWSFLLLFTLIHFGAWQEYQRLLGRIDADYAQITVFHRYGIQLTGFCALLYFTGDSFSLGGIRLHALGWWTALVCIFLLPVMELLFNPQIRIKNLGYSVLGLLYLSLPLGLMMDLRSLDRQWISWSGRPMDLGLLIALGIIFSIWINDTMAYIVGSLIGRTPFSPISPKKTWEGTIGGVILCVAGMTWLAHAIGFNQTDAAVIAALSAVAGTAGDLLESKIKRMAHVKDSGRIMPGHGGFLDRFDSLLLAVPFVWLYVHFYLR